MTDDKQPLPQRYPYPRTNEALSEMLTLCDAVTAACNGDGHAGMQMLHDGRYIPYLLAIRQKKARGTQ